MLSIQSPSYAKLNLFLRVLGRDPEGYHLLESFFAVLDTYDEISIEKSDRFICRVMGGEVMGENIVLKTLKEIEKYRGPLEPVHICINKQIPIAAGMGGGSSNAATTIKLINELYKLDLSLKEMQEIAYNIGADVTFFITNEHAFVSGRGEKLFPLKLGITLPIVILYPQLHMSTQQVFASGIKEFSTPLNMIDRSTVINEIYYGYNDLTSSAMKIAPILHELLSTIQAQHGCIAARMSGSGSTCFGIFDDETCAQEAYDNLKSQYPKFWVYRQLLRL